MTITKASKIFITGASGFLGQHVIRLLADQGYSQLTCLSRQQNPTNSSDYQNPTACQWIIGDLLDMPLLEDQLTDQDIIIHMAADVTFNLKNKSRLLQEAIATSANLVNAAMEKGVKKIIYVSSVAAIGRKKQKEQIDENVLFSHSPYDTTYGLTKFLGEQEVWRGHAEGLETTVLCPSLILGIGDWNKSSIQLFHKIHTGMRFYPTGTTGWVSVEDVAQAILLALQGDFSGQRFIISAQNLSYQEVFNQIATAVQAKKPTTALTPTLGKTLLTLDKLKSLFSNSEPLLTKETLMSTSVESIYDNTKSMRELGLQYKDIRTTIQEAGKAFLKSV